MDDDSNVTLLHAVHDLLQDTGHVQVCVVVFKVRTHKHLRAWRQSLGVQHECQHGGWCVAGDDHQVSGRLLGRQVVAQKLANRKILQVRQLRVHAKLFEEDLHDFLEIRQVPAKVPLQGVQNFLCSQVFRKALCPECLAPGIEVLDQRVEVSQTPKLTTALLSHAGHQSLEASRELPEPWVQRRRVNNAHGSLS